MYVATVSRDGSRDRVLVFDTRTCNASRSTGCGQRPEHLRIADGSDAGSTMDLALNQRTNTVYVTRVTFSVPFGGQTVYVIDGATCDAADTSGCGRTPATVRLGATFFGDAGPLGVAVVEATDTIYTANISDGEGPGSVSVIDGAVCNGRVTSGCGQVPATAPAGFGTSSIAADQTTHRVYAGNVEDTSVTTIDGDACRGGRTSGCGRTLTRPIVGDYPSSVTVVPMVGTAYVADGGGVSV